MAENQAEAPKQGTPFTSIALPEATQYSGRFHIELPVEDCNLSESNQTKLNPSLAAPPVQSLKAMRFQGTSISQFQNQMVEANLKPGGKEPYAAICPAVGVFYRATQDTPLKPNLDRITSTLWVRPDAEIDQELLALDFGQYQSNQIRYLIRILITVNSHGVPQLRVIRANEQNDLINRDRTKDQVKVPDDPWFQLLAKQWHRMRLQVKWEKNKPQGPSPNGDKTSSTLSIRCYWDDASEPQLVLESTVESLNYDPNFQLQLFSVRLGCLPRDERSETESLEEQSKTKSDATFYDFRIYSSTSSYDLSDLLLHWTLNQADGASGWKNLSGDKWHGTLIPAPPELPNEHKNDYWTLTQIAPVYSDFSPLGSSSPPTSPAIAPVVITSPPSKEKIEAVIQAFNRFCADEKESQGLDTDLFPYVTQDNTAGSRHHLRMALKALGEARIRERYASGYALSVNEAPVSCCPKVGFVNVSSGAAGKRRLILILDIRLSSFMGKVGKGRLVNTMTLFPGEKTKIAIRTYRKTEREATTASTIFDSFTTASAQEFERSLNSEQSTNRHEDMSQAYYAKVQADASWGWGNASIEGSANIDIKSSLDQLTHSVSNSSSKQAANASANREVRVESHERTDTLEDEAESIEREIENINVGRTLNFLFWQLNQEVISTLHVVDMKVATFDGTPESVREYPIEHFLTVIQEQFKITDTSKLEGILTKLGLSNLKVQDNKVLFDRTTLTQLNPIDSSVSADMMVRGAVLKIDHHVLRTANVWVDAELGEDVALDTYSANLQIETNRELKLKNDQMEMDLQKNRLGLEIVHMAKEDERASAFRTIFGKQEKIVAPD